MRDIVDEKTKERFHKNYTPSDINECWEWKGLAFGSGYGRFSYNGSSTTAHRFAMMLHINDVIDPYMDVCHKCDNRICVNLNHLFIGTPKENAEDKVRKGRHVSLPGETSPTHKLKTHQVLDILKSKLPHRHLARVYGVCDRTIRLIRLRETWRHLDV